MSYDSSGNSGGGFVNCDTWALPHDSDTSVSRQHPCIRGAQFAYLESLWPDGGVADCLQCIHLAYLGPMDQDLFIGPVAMGVLHTGPLRKPVPASESPTLKNKNSEVPHFPALLS